MVGSGQTVIECGAVIGTIQVDSGPSAVGIASCRRLCLLQLLSLV